MTDLAWGLVQQHGAIEVWLAGLGALGYPPTWIHTRSELLKLNQALEKS